MTVEEKRRTYIYPDNLRSSGKLWLWRLRDLAIIGVAGTLSLVSLVALGTCFPVAMTLLYAFLTMRADETSVLDYLRRAVRYFVLSPAEYRMREQKAPRKKNFKFFKKNGKERSWRS